MRVTTVAIGFAAAAVLVAATPAVAVEHTARPTASKSCLAAEKALIEALSNAADWGEDATARSARMRHYGACPGATWIDVVPLGSGTWISAEVRGKAKKMTTSNKKVVGLTSLMRNEDSDGNEMWVIQDVAVGLGRSTICVIGTESGYKECKVVVVPAKVTGSLTGKARMFIGDPAKLVGVPPITLITSSDQSVVRVESSPMPTDPTPAPSPDASAEPGSSTPTADAVMRYSAEAIGVGKSKVCVTRQGWKKPQCQTWVIKK